MLCGNTELTNKIEGNTAGAIMNCDGEEKQWSCGKAGSVNLHMMGSIMREISDPCMFQSPIKVAVAVRRMLKPDKWQAVFDSDGKASGFHKALKLIILGGVDPSIRPEVWEFLLGCYALGSTAEYRQQLRTARRKHFQDLLMQCQKMHSSVGTGSLAYAVGCKVMDMRTSSRDERKMEDDIRSRKTSLDNIDKSKKLNDSDDIYSDKSFKLQRGSLSHSDEFVSVRESADSAAYDSSVATPCRLACQPVRSVRETPGSESPTESYLDPPSLHFTNLFDDSRDDEDECDVLDDKHSEQCNLRFKDNRMHSFQINNNEDLIIESNGSPSERSSIHKNSEIEIVQTDACEKVSQSSNAGYERAILNGLRISDVPQMQLVDTTASQGVASSEERVSEWLWTLHRIVVDVVRTDNHLEFYEDTRNLARMSDILAVYAWVDPATGYCQGMSDLLSPFVVLFEDDADAFWCFEMLLRRMRENFQMEGPTGVMKQLQALWHIIRLTDREMFAHLSRIGAESLHFAFPMLLVLFRRELTFDEALCMWEMMWAADFNESVAYSLEEKCLESLVVQLPIDCQDEVSEDGVENGNSEESCTTQKNLESCSTTNGAIKSGSSRPFCGLTRNFWARDDHMQMTSSFSSTKNGDDELAVFCVAAILITNRQKIIRQTRSIDDMIKIFNDKMLKIHVKSCVHMAIKLRKKYFYKLIKQKSPAIQNGEDGT